jgi:hypothetical protein
VKVLSEKTFTYPPDPAVTLELVPNSDLVYENEDSLTGSFVGGFDTECLSDVESLNQNNPAPIRSNSMPLKKKTPTVLQPLLLFN